MTDEAKRCVEIIRYCSTGNDGNHCKECPYLNSDTLEKPCVNILRSDAADMIESLSVQLEQVEKERDGLNIMLAQAQAMLETRTKERDAAVQDLEMCCPCEVCTRSCKYDKVNAYDECADFEWRGVREVERYVMDFPLKDANDDGRSAEIGGRSAEIGG